MIVMLFFLFGRPGTLGLLLRPVLWFLWIPRIHCYTETACRDEAHISHFWKTVKRFFWKNIKNILTLEKKELFCLHSDLNWREFKARLSLKGYPSWYSLLSRRVFPFAWSRMAVPKSSSQGCYIGERNMTEIIGTNSMENTLNAERTWLEWWSHANQSQASYRWFHRNGIWIHAVAIRAKVLLRVNVECWCGPIKTTELCRDSHTTDSYAEVYC